MSTTWLIAGYAAHLLSLATLIMTMFINNRMPKMRETDESRANLLTQINWLCIGAASVVSMFNINAIINVNTGLMSIGVVISIITAALTGGCLAALDRKVSLPKKKKN